MIIAGAICRLDLATVTTTVAERVLSKLADLLVLARPRIILEAFMQELEGIPLVFPEDRRAFEGLLRAHRGLVEARFWGVRPWTRALMPKCYRM